MRCENLNCDGEVTRFNKIKFFGGSYIVFAYCRDCFNSIALPQEITREEYESLWVLQE
jgi:hypothetical protein